MIQGAEFPLLNSKEETERWEALYGKFRYKGCWSDFSKRPGNVPPAFRAGYHEPDVVPPWSKARRTPSRSTKPRRILSFAWCTNILAKW